MQVSAIFRRFRQAGSLGSYVRMVQHVVCRKLGWRLLGTGRAVGLRVVGAPGPFWFRLGSTDFHTALEVFCEGEYAEVVGALAGIPGGAGVVVDLGSNVGYSAMVWRAAWPGCTVVAVEPDEGNLELARANLEAATARVAVEGKGGAGGTGRNLYLHAAVSDRPGRGSLDRSDGAWAYRLAEGRGLAEVEAEVEVVTMGRVLAMLPAGVCVDLLKCDIEGAEAAVFGPSGGAGEWLGRVRHLVVETHAPYSLGELEADLTAAGAGWERLSVSHHGTTAVGFYRLGAGRGG